MSKPEKVPGAGEVIPTGGDQSAAGAADRGQDESPWPTDFEHILRKHCRFTDSETAIDPDASLTALGVDSFGLLVFIFEIEERFSLNFPDAMLTGDAFTTPRTVWRAVETIQSEARGDGAGMSTDLAGS
jgi:acyl carrier protein